MYVTKEDREVIAKTIRAVVEDVYKTPKYYEANDVILSPSQGIGRVSVYHPAFLETIWLVYSS